ncbi:MAG: protein kinase, partial [Planctomycetota bacterium]
MTRPDDPRATTPDPEIFLAHQESLGHQAIALGYVPAGIVTSQWNVLRRRHYRGHLQYGLLDLLLQRGDITAQQKLHIEQTVAGTTGGNGGHAGGAEADAVPSMMVDSQALGELIEADDAASQDQVDAPMTEFASLAPFGGPDHNAGNDDDGSPMSMMVDTNVLESEIGDLTPSLQPVYPDQPAAPPPPRGQAPIPMTVADVADDVFDEPEAMSAAEASLMLDTNVLESELMQPESPSHISFNESGNLPMPPLPPMGVHDESLGIEIPPEGFAPAGGGAAGGTLLDMGAVAGSSTHAPSPFASSNDNDDDDQVSGGGGATLLDMGPSSSSSSPVTRSGSITPSEIEGAFGSKSASGVGPTMTAGGSRGPASQGPPSQGSGVSGVVPPTMVPVSASGSAIPAKMGLQARIDVSHHFGEGKDAGKRIGRYGIQTVIGKGGMGEVLGVRDRDLNRDVALKQLLAGRGARQSQVDKFLIEAQVTGQLEHPNIVPVHELGLQADGSLYFTMKFVRGRSLNQILKELRRRETKEGKDKEMRDYHVTELLEMFLKVCDGVAFAHSRNVVHRDLKPDNVMVGEFGEVLVMDWGLAKVRGVADKVEDSVKIDLHGSDIGQAARGGSASGDVVKTMDGMVLGTPSFMPPEQAQGEIDQIDQRSDIYSLGAILYQTLTLQLPVEGRSPLEVLMKVAKSEITPPTQRAPQRRISPELEAVVMKAMAFEREKRYQTVLELQDDIRAWLEGKTLSAVDYSLLGRLSKFVKRNKAMVGAAMLLVLVAGGLIGFFMWKNQQDELARYEQTQQQIAKLLDEARDLMDRGARQHETDIALEDYRSAEQKFREALFADRTNTDAEKGRDEATKAALTIQAKKDAAEQSKKEQELQLRAQRDAEKQAEKLKDDALALVKQGQQILIDNGPKLSSMSDAERGALAQSLVGTFDEARSKISLAQEKGKTNGDLLKLLNVAAQEVSDKRADAIKGWEEKINNIARRDNATATAAQARAELGKGTTAWDGARDHLKYIRNNPGEDHTERRAELEHLQSDTFAALLKANDLYGRAVAILNDLPDVSTELATINAERLQLALLLCEGEIWSGAFQRADFWLGEAAGYSPQGTEDPAVKDMAAFFATEKAIAAGYGSAMAAGRRESDAGNHEAAIGHFERALQVLQTDEARDEITRARFGWKLQLAREAREGKRWLDARQHYADAGEFAKHNDERNSQIDLLTKEAVAQGTADLVARAKIALDKGTEAGTTEGAALLDECLQLDPDSPEANTLRTRLVALQDTPEGFVYIAGGRVTLGSTRTSDRNPARTATLAPFYMATREITVAEYKLFLDAGGMDTDSYWSEAGLGWRDALDTTTGARKPQQWDIQLANPGFPVTGVSYYEAEAYCAWFATVSGKPCRLPTDAEFELCARHEPTDALAAGHEYPWGNDWAKAGLD